MTNEPKFQIAVLDRGFVYVGMCRLEGGMLTITGASCVRRWGAENGLGQIALAGPTRQTKLDPAGTVHAPTSAVMHLIDCNPAAWPAVASVA